MLERFFGGCDGGFFGMGWWIIILFFLFLAFGETWVDIDIMALEFINLPALFSEFVTIPICYFILKNGKNKKIASF